MSGDRVEATLARGKIRMVVLVEHTPDTDPPKVWHWVAGEPDAEEPLAYGWEADPATACMSLQTALQREGWHVAGLAHGLYRDLTHDPTEGR